MEMINILEITIPAVLVLLTAYFLIDKLLKNEEKRRNFELIKNNQATLSPIRLRAYERLALLLERTTPAALILSVAKPGMNNSELQKELLETIRREFNHNLSQQIYVSNELWNHIKATEESLLRLVNSCSANCAPADTASVLAEMILHIFNESQDTPTEIAQNKLKSEVSRFF